MEEQDKAEIEIVGTVQRVNQARSGKATFVNLRVAGVRDSYFEATAFYALAGIAKGDRVRIAGRLGSEKLDGVKRAGKDGREFDTWIPKLVIERIEVLAEGQGNIPGTGKGEPPPNDDIPF